MNKIFLFILLIIFVLSSTDEQNKERYKRKVLSHVGEFLKEKDEVKNEPSAYVYDFFAQYQKSSVRSPRDNFDNEKFLLDLFKHENKAINEKYINEPNGVDGIFAQFSQTRTNFENVHEKVNELNEDNFKAFYEKFMNKVTPRPKPQIFKEPVKSTNFNSLISFGFDCENKIPESVESRCKKNEYQTLVDCYTRSVYYNHGDQKDIEQASQLITLFSKEELEYVECSGLSRSIQHKPQSLRDLKKGDKEDSPKQQMLKMFDAALLGTTEHNPFDDDENPKFQIGHHKI